MNGESMGKTENEDEIVLILGWVRWWVIKWFDDVIHMSLHWLGTLLSILYHHQQHHQNNK